MTTHPTIELRGEAGGEVLIELTSYPGAGAVWVMPDAPAGCSIDDAGRAPADAGIGGPVTQRFRLCAARAGHYVILFELKRPWESAVRAVQPVVVDVR